MLLPEAYQKKIGYIIKNDRTIAKKPDNEITANATITYPIKSVISGKVIGLIC